MRLDQARILITGASSGIGAATARAAADAGATPLLVARRRDALDDVAGEIAATGGTAHCYPADLADAEQRADLAGRIRRESGAPDIVVHNAGAGRWRPLEATDAGELAQMMAVPALAALDLTRALLPAMRARGRGRLVMVNSVAADLVWPNAAGYIAARHALRGAADALRTELNGTGIGVSEVTLGTVTSPYWAHNPGSREHLPKPIPGLMPELGEADAARHVLDAVRRDRRQIVAPPVFRALRLMRALTPGTVEAAMRR